MHACQKSDINVSSRHHDWVADKELNKLSYIMGIYIVNNRISPI